MRQCIRLLSDVGAQSWFGDRLTVPCAMLALTVSCHAVPCRAAMCVQPCEVVASSYTDTYEPQLQQAVAAVAAQRRLAEALFGPAAVASGAFPSTLSAEPEAVPALLAAMPAALPVATGQVAIGVPVPTGV